MHVASRSYAAFLGVSVLMSGLAAGAAAAATFKFVKDGAPFRLDQVQQEPGGQSAPVLTRWDLNGGFVATWLNYRSAGDRRAFVGFFSSSASGLFPISEMGAASGPTSGRPATSAAPVSFTGGTSLVLFSADKRGAAAGARRDVFAQRMGNGPWTPVGTPVAVNQGLPNAQESVMAARLSGGNALVAFVSHATAASSFNIRGRILNGSAGAVTAEKALTADTAGAQTPTALAALSNGGAVLAYVVRSGARQQALVQRLNALGNRVGGAKLLKTTTGGATYGGAGVAALPGGRFLAVWFVAGNGGTASLKGRIFSAAGAPGPLLSIGTSHIRTTVLSVPKIAIASDGHIVVLTDGFAGGVSSVDGWLLGATGSRILGPVKLATGASALTAGSLLPLPSLYFVGAWTQGAAQPTATRALALRFHVVQCGRAC